MFAIGTLYILMLVMGDGDIKYVQGLNQKTCHFMRDTAISASHAITPGSPKEVQYALCINTLDPQGTP